jgi:hypothetical protein
MGEDFINLLVLNIIQRQVPLPLPCYDFTPVNKRKVKETLQSLLIPIGYAPSF